MNKRWIVWTSKEKFEGVIFDEESDADYAMSANPPDMVFVSSLADDFQKRYGWRGKCVKEEFVFP